MTEARLNLVFRGEVESGYDQNAARSTLESLFEFDTENVVDFFKGQTVILGENMTAPMAQSFKQALAGTGIITHIIATNEACVEEDSQSPRLVQRRKNSDRRARLRAAAILPDRRLALDRRS